MLNKLVSDTSGNWRNAPFLTCGSQVTEKSLGREQYGPTKFNSIGSCVAFVACCLVLFLLALSSPARLSAQTAGTITGHISDTTGAAVPDTNVALKNVATGSERSTVTTGSGDYTFPEVPVGVYTITATHAGFKAATSNNVQVQVQQSIRLDFSLQVGAVTQSIEVEASAALLQSENATLGSVVENKAIIELPLNGRNYLSLVALSSNVNTLSSSSGQAGSRMGGDRASQSISVGGQRIMFDYYTLDGINNTDPDFNTYVGLPSLDGIQEFKVQTGVYPAEFGHEATQVNVVSKSGTNSYHGSMYDFIRNNTADATPYYFPYNSKPPSVFPFKWNDYGFELDGPIRIPHVYNGRDKFFFMVDDEWRKIRSINQGNATVPSPAIASGNYQGFTTAAGVPVTIYDPATGDANGLGKTPFPNNTIPDSRITAQSKALLKYLGTSTQPFYSGGKSVSNLPYATRQPQNRQGLAVRGDYIQSSKLQYAFRYSSGNEDILSTAFMGAGSKTITNYYQYMGSNTWTISPTIVNEARFGYNHFFNSLGLLSGFTNDVVDAIGIPGLKGGDPSTWGIPDMAFSQGPAGTTTSIWQEIGDIGGDGPYVITDPTWQIIDNVSLVKGKHSLRAGFEFSRQTFNQLGNQFSRGQFFAQPISTALETKDLNSGKVSLSGGDSLADFLLGNLSQATVAVAVANANYERSVQSYYLDDTYKVLQNLTVSAGIRYELTPPWNDTFGNNFNAYVPNLPKMGDTSATYAQSLWPHEVRQGNCSPADVYQGLNIRWTQTYGPAPQCSSGLLPNGPLMDTSFLNFAPRLGISYSPDSRTVIRAGFGIFYTQDIGNAYFDMARNIAGRATAINVDTNAPYGNSNLTWGNAAPGASGGTTVTLGPTTVEYANAPSHKTSYTEQFLFNIQRQVGQDWSFEIGYQGAVSRHLYGFINANQPTPYGYLGTGAVTSVASRLPYYVGLAANGSPAQYGIQYQHDQGTGNYNAFSAKATRRFSKGLSVIASYTWGKSLDDSSGIRNQGNDNLYPQNSECIRCEYGPSAFDVRNRIVGSANYELPLGQGKLINTNKAVGEFVGGWQIGGIFTHQTGQVGTPLLGIDNASIASPFGNFDRPIPTGTSPYLKGSARTLTDWVDITAYAVPTAGTFGSLQRGSFTGPGFTNFDASLHKAFNMPYNEKHQLAIRFEAFNALNHPNWNNPTLNNVNSAVGKAPGTTTFGRITSTTGPAPNGGMRQLQLAAKYQF